MAAVQAQSLKCVRLCHPMGPAAHQAPLSMGFPGQAYWGGLPFPPPGDLPHPGIQPMFPVSPALAARFFTAAPPGKHFLFVIISFKMCHPELNSFLQNTDGTDLTTEKVQ